MRYGRKNEKPFTYRSPVLENRTVVVLLPLQTGIHRSADYDNKNKAQYAVVASDEIVSALIAIRSFVIKSD